MIKFACGWPVQNSSGVIYWEVHCIGVHYLLCIAEAQWQSGEKIGLFRPWTLVISSAELQHEMGLAQTDPSSSRGTQPLPEKGWEKERETQSRNPLELSTSKGLW